jgi:cobalamin-dependent methionine synthase I
MLLLVQSKEHQVYEGVAVIDIKIERKMVDDEVAMHEFRAISLDKA